MSARVKKHCSLIKLLAKSPLKRRRDILKLAPKELVLSFSEGALNILKGNVPLTARKKTSLKRYRKNIYDLSSRKTALSTKRAILMSGGAFFPLLASVLIPAITALIGSR